MERRPKTSRRENAESQGLRGREPWDQEAAILEDEHEEERSAKRREVGREVRRGETRNSPSAENLEREVDENSNGHVFLQQTLLEKFERGDRVVGHESDFGEEVDDDEGLNVCRVEDSGSVARIETRRTEGEGKDGRFSLTMLHMTE